MRRIVLLLAVANAAVADAKEPAAFEAAIDAAAAEAGLAAAESPCESLTGRLFVFLSQRDQGEPRFGPNWFGPEPFFAIDVRDAKGGDVVEVGQGADGFPAALDTLPAGKYRVQALFDHDFYCHSPARGVGNLFSDVVEWEHSADENTPRLRLELDRFVEPRPFPEAPHLREIVISSKLLSDFHGRDVKDFATVVLPAGYDDHPERRYPVIYDVPGFGGGHRRVGQYHRPPQAADGEAEFIRVLLSGDCKWGHHVYADSATNGPRGAALVHELIPHVDRSFRTVAEPTARFLTGHSSGGWSSLWLQTTYPDSFGGVWSVAPDPVDFRDYQQVDLYAEPPLSLYFDQQGERRPIARQGETPVLWYADFGRMDDVLGRGGQLRSFEAVFSPRGADGLPRKLWDRQTGAVDPEVAQAWRAFDINLRLHENWPELGPKLTGKLHVFTGEFDTFYLDGAVRLLKQTLDELGSDAVVEVHEGRDHGSVLTPELMSRIRREMSQRFWTAHGQQQTSAEGRESAEQPAR